MVKLGEVLVRMFRFNILILQLKWNILNYIEMEVIFYFGCNFVSNFVFKIILKWAQGVFDVIIYLF